MKKKLKKNNVFYLESDVKIREQYEDLEYCRSVFSKYEDNMESNFDNDEVLGAYFLAHRIRIANKTKNLKIYYASIDVIKIYAEALYKNNKNVQFVWVAK